MIGRTVIATPPGRAIKEQLEYRGMTQKEFALRMSLSEKHISKLINGEVHLTPDVAVRLEATLGVPAEFWNNLEAIYQSKLRTIEEENAMDVDIAIAKQMPFAEMVKLRWIDSAKKVTDKVRTLRRFFEVARLGVIDNLMMPGIAYRRMGGNAKSDYVLAAWAQRARLVAREREVEPINLQKLSELIDDIRALTKTAPEEFVSKLERYYADCGIAVVFLPSLKGSFLHGASFIDGKKIVMGLTLRGYDADKFWFSLFHETAHILKGHIAQKHGTTAEDEAEADNFASDVLIPPEAYKNFTSIKDYSYSTVKNFADEVGIDAGIVVGRLQHDGELGFDKLTSLKKQYQFS